MLGRVTKKLQSRYLFILATSSVLIAAGSARAETNYASEQRKNAALGHYARARTMMVEALAEFEQARKYARPDMMLDPEEWRLSVISRTEELNRLLDPRPRVTLDGVRFQANKLLIRREKDRTPVVSDGAKEKNYLGEAERREEKRQTRARLELPEDEKVKVIPRKDVEQERKEARQKAEAELSFSPNGASKAEMELAAPPTNLPPAEPESRGSLATSSPDESAAKKADAIVKDQAELQKQEAELIDDEEEVASKPVEASKAPFTLKADETSQSSSQAQTLEQKEDEVTREIEQAIQNRIQKEKVPGGEAIGEEDDQ